MKLSAPIYQLKRQAKSLAREQGIPLHEALDRVAKTEGFPRWGLLAAQHAAVSPATRLYQQLNPGDMVLIGARPGQGKTLISLEVAVEAMRAGHQSIFFTLEYTEGECRDRFRDIGAELDTFSPLFSFDGSDAISADYIANRLKAATPGDLAIIDYLQLLDQKRDKPDLMTQVQALRSFAKDKGVILLFISQIDRSYDPAAKPYPDLSDVRLPNPLDLGLFDKACFLNQGEIRYSARP